MIEEVIAFETPGERKDYDKMYKRESEKERRKKNG